MIWRTERFFCTEGGGASVEFVAVMPFFMLITFFVIEIAIAVFLIETAEKAGQIGARMAIVGTPAVTTANCPVSGAPSNGLPLRNCRASSTVVYGTSCSVASTCATWGPVECVGGTSGDCSSDGFQAIANRIRSIFGRAADENITVRYEDSQLGYAGGPIIPLVTVEISNVDYDLFFPFLFERMRALANPGTDPAPSVFTTMPTIATTLTGEDLSAAGG